MNKKQYQELADLMEKWNEEYVNDNSVVLDSEYDKHFREMVEFEERTGFIASNSVTNKVGAGTIHGEKVKHERRMWSQQDIITEKELSKFISKVMDVNKSPSFLIEGKYDGLSLKLIYVEGKLTKAITRGDGFVGEDVTTNARLINTIPETIDAAGVVEVCGEVVMEYSVFAKLNEQREKEGKKLFANPRNAAAGSIRVHDPVESGRRQLTFVPWELWESDNENDTVMLDVTALTQYGFTMPITVFVTDRMSQITDIYDSHIKMRQSQPFPLDGMVIKVMEKETHKCLSNTSRYRGWSIAYKFPPVSDQAVVLDIVWQIGRTGKLAPVAKITPTLIDGSVVSSATLHNFNEIQISDIRIGDKIDLIKAGDIIPAVAKVHTDKRTATLPVTKLPSKCPACDSDLVIDDNNAMCVNSVCKGVLAKRLELYGSRDYVNIDGLGTSTCDKLVTSNLVSDPVDLYSLTMDNLKELPRFNSMSATTLYNNIQASIGVELYRVVASLGIPSVGRSLSKDLCSKYGLDIFTMSREELLRIPCIGPVICNNFINYVKDNMEYIDRLLSVVKPTVTIAGTVTGTLTGKKVVLTGAFTGGKSSVKKLIDSEGGKVVSSVSGNTDILVYGENPGNSKMTKAKDHNVTTMSYDEFLKSLS